MTEYRRMISEFDNYVAIWASLVSVGSRDGSEKSFTDFVRSTLESTQLTSQAVLALGLLADQDAYDNNRISTPHSEEDATVGCRTALVAARSHYGTVLARRLLSYGCRDSWIEFQVAQELGDTNDNWITWLAIRLGRGRSLVPAE